MGCWGITAFESDTGLDAVGFIRKNLPMDGQLQLDKIIEDMKKVEWCVPDVAECYSHTGPMALAEIMQKFLDNDMSDLDYDEEWAADDNKFSSVTSFTATKESLQWLRDYVSDTLKYTLENAEFRAKQGSSKEDQWGGWFKEENWHGWQDHMSKLVNCIDTLLSSAENQIELIEAQTQTNDPDMAMNL